MEKYETLSEQTIQLATICSNSFTPDIAQLKVLIRDGADPNRTGYNMKQPILHTLVKRGNVEAVHACLSSSHVIDFTLRDSYRSNPLHWMCDATVSDDTTLAMLSAVVERIEASPNDHVDWGQKNGGGKTVLMLAAENQKLSLIWNVVKGMPFFDDAIEPLSLGLHVWKWDWDALGTEQQFFHINADLIEADRATAGLCQIACSLTPQCHVDLQRIERYIAEGADVLFTDPLEEMPVLHRVLLFGDAEAIQACFTTSRSIDFSLRTYGETLLHCVCTGEEGKSEQVTKLLHIFLNRIETHPSDNVDWSVKDSKGHDFLSWEAFRGRLSLVWPILKERRVPYFMEYAEKIPLTLKVFVKDWNALPKSEQDRFYASKGFK